LEHHDQWADRAERPTIAGAEQLPIADYDSLTAGQIVQSLPGLSQRGLQKVESYE
jgi:hypothetical protein